MPERGGKFQRSGITTALAEARSRWGWTACVREMRHGRGKICEVGVADTSGSEPPWSRPIRVLGSGSSWIRAFAESDAATESEPV